MNWRAEVKLQGINSSVITPPRSRSSPHRSMSAPTPIPDPRRSLRPAADPSRRRGGGTPVAPMPMALTPSEDRSARHPRRGRPAQRAGPRRRGHRRANQGNITHPSSTARPVGQPAVEQDGPSPIDPSAAGGRHRTGGQPADRGRVRLAARLCQPDRSTVFGASVDPSPHGRHTRIHRLPGTSSSCRASRRYACCGGRPCDAAPTTARHGPDPGRRVHGRRWHHGKKPTCQENRWRPASQTAPRRNSSPFELSRFTETSSVKRALLRWGTDHVVGSLPNCGPMNAADLLHEVAPPARRPARPRSGTYLYLRRTRRAVARELVLQLWLPQAPRSNTPLTASWRRCCPAGAQALGNE